MKTDFKRYKNFFDKMNIGYGTREFVSGAAYIKIKEEHISKEQHIDEDHAIKLWFDEDGKFIAFEIYNT